MNCMMASRGIITRLPTATCAIRFDLISPRTCDSVTPMSAAACFGVMSIGNVGSGFTVLMTVTCFMQAQFGGYSAASSS
jgi:hypothetical protein